MVNCTKDFLAQSSLPPINILFGQQVPALNQVISFMREDLNPKTERTLHASVNSMLMPTILGLVVLFAEFAWAAKQQLLDQKGFILLMFYEVAMLQNHKILMIKLIEGISSWGLFANVLGYIQKGMIPNERLYEEVENTSIEVVNVSYTYPKAEHPVIKNFSAKIERGTMVAITGENGNGKSTLFKMLFGFAKPDEGTILIGGQDLATLNPDSYRKACAFVPQKPSIVPGTFKSNIACRSDVPDEVVKAIMDQVGLVDYRPEENIEFGYEGPKISGGERQRIMLARALLEIQQGNIQYLFLDEGFASLSGDGERSLLELLYKVVCGKNITTIMITHDLPRMQEVITFYQIITMPRQTRATAPNRYHFLLTVPDKSSPPYGAGEPPNTESRIDSPINLDRTP